MVQLLSETGEGKGFVRTMVSWVAAIENGKRGHPTRAEVPIWRVY